MECTLCGEPNPTYEDPVSGQMLCMNAEACLMRAAEDETSSLYLSYEDERDDDYASPT